MPSAGPRHVGDHRQGQAGRRRSALLQHVPPPRKQAGVERLSRRRGLGLCRQFTCKYHAWRYSLEGDLTFVQQEDEFFDLDKANFGLVPVRCEVWEGFIFINFDNDAAPLIEYLGDFAEGPRGLSVPRDDRALQLSLGNQRQLEAVHRRVHGVLPRADPAHEAGGEGGGREAGQVRLRGAGVRHQGRSTRWCRPGAGCRRPRT